MDIELFTGPGCAQCESAKRLLRERALSWREQDVSQPQALAAFRARLPRERALPQVFIDGEHAGGLEDLRLRLR
jgi:glutaredoxin 3